MVSHFSLLLKTGLFLIKYILTMISPHSSPHSPFSLPLSHTNLPFSSEKGRPSISSYNKLGTSSPIEARQGSLIGGKGSKGRHQSQPLLQLLRIPHEDQDAYLLHGPVSVPCMFFGWWFSFCEPLWIEVSWFCRFPCSVLEPPGKLEKGTSGVEGLSWGGVAEWGVGL